MAKNSRNFQTVPNILHNNASLVGIIAKAKRLQNLNLLLAKHIDGSLVNEVQILNLEGTVLVLGVKNASVASEVNFSKTELITNLKKLPEFCGINAIKVKVEPDNCAKPIENNKNNIVMSTHAKQQLGFAAQMVNNPKLKAVLERLSQD